MAVIHTILQIAAIVGIIAFCWSVSSSLESIAKDLKRLVDSREPLTLHPSERRSDFEDPAKAA